MVLYKNKNEELRMYKEYKIDWTQLRTADNENPQILPDKIWAMLHADKDEVADDAYWKIEGNAFFQRNLYQATEPVTTIVTNEIHLGNFNTLGLGFALDLLVEIAYGWSVPSEKERGNADLADRCREKIRAIMPDLYRLAETQTDQRVLQGIVDLTDELEPSKQQRAKLFSVITQHVRDRCFIEATVRNLRLD